MPLPWRILLNYQFCKINLTDSPKCFQQHHESWWRHQIDTFPALLAFCTENSPITGEFPAQMPVTRNFDHIIAHMYLHLLIAKCFLIALYIQATTDRITLFELILTWIWHGLHKTQPGNHHHHIQKTMPIAIITFVLFVQSIVPYNAHLSTKIYIRRKNMQIRLCV